MPVEIVTDDIFELDVDARVCPTNCLGVMGKGLALAFAKRYPSLEREYRRHIDRTRPSVYPGDLWTWKTSNGDGVICITTKDHWRDNSRLDWVEHGLLKLANWLKFNPGKSVAVPALGCGLGGLDWEVVRPLMLDILGGAPNTVYLLEPGE